MIAVKPQAAAGPPLLVSPGAPFLLSQDTAGGDKAHGACV